jgi:hypothetical protein
MRAIVVVLNLATAVCLLATLGVELAPVVARWRTAVPIEASPPAEPVRRDVQAVHEAFPEAKPQSPAAAPLPGPESRVYEGQPYAHWRAQLFSETHPGKRLAAVQAVATLGANGHAPAAARDLLDILKTCAPPPTAQSSDEALLLEALKQGLVRIGPESEPVLLEGLRDSAGPDHARQTCAQLLAATGHRASEWVPALVAWHPTADLRSQQLARIALRGETPVAPALLSALAGTLEKTDAAGRLLLLDVLREIGTGTRSITPQVLRRLGSGDSAERAASVAALEAAGFFLAYEAGELADYGLKNEAVYDPALLPGYRTALELARNNALQEGSTLAVLKLLGRMGPAARDSAGSIEPLAASDQPEPVRTAAREALGGMR